MKKRNVVSKARRAWLSVGVAAVSILTMTGGLHAQVSLPIGTVGPDAVVEDLDGNTIQLLDLVAEGQPALFEFWASWCENCEALQPQLDQIQAEHGDDISIVAVAVAVSQKLRRVKRHVAEEGHAYPFVWDAQGAAVRAYGALTTSIVVILDAQGIVVYTGAGGDQDLLGAVGLVLPDPL